MQGEVLTLPSTIPATIPLPVLLYLAAWLVGGLLVVWSVVKVLKAREKDGTPTLYFYLRQMPKQEMLMAVGIMLVLGTAIPTLWRLAYGLTMGPAFSEWLLFVAGLLAINGATYVGKRATFRAEAVDVEATG